MKQSTGILIRATLGWAVASLLGSSWILLARSPGLPVLAAAQTTAAIIGFGGGLSYAAAFRAAGGRVDRKNGLLLALVWSLCCILGVTPLFFTLGTPLKMTVAAFYSFSAAGALGAGVSLRRMRSLLPRAAGGAIIPATVAWSLGFGAAAAASNVVGDALQRFAPEWLAWFMAYEAMALLAGGAGCLAISRFLAAPAAPPAAVHAPRGHASSAVEPGHPAAAALLLCLPFYLNDLCQIYIADWRYWLAIDYAAVRLFPLLVLAWLIHGGKADFTALGWRVDSSGSFFSVLTVAALAALFIDQNGYLIADWFGGAPGGRLPEIGSPLWRGIDLTAGLAAVSVVEETIFRGYLRIFLFRYTRRTGMVIAISAIGFGLAHWSGGVERVVTTSAIGVVFMALYLRTQSLPAITIAHYIVNLVALLGAAPPSPFRFF